ncbi:MAG TPA: DUF1684 domain-containing protein [Rhizomicrobium sp.]|jgi:uncharacterized protein (DUF1684 family)|nr:DUF1684 domain-containing protein [Rhizomicrobium sp.]
MRAVAALSIATTSLLLTAAAPTPEAAWKAGIADQNKAYAVTPHAMLKIQDAAYLHDGDSAMLVGRRGVPGSYHWTTRPGAQGILLVTLRNGKLAVARNGKPADPAAITKSIAIDRNVDVEGQPTQVDAGVQGWRIFVFNQKSPVAESFKGVSYFPYDPAFRVTAQFSPDPRRRPRVFRTSRGTDKQFYRVGEARFMLAGKSVRLPMYAGENDPKKIKDFSAFFTDDLTGKGAYGSGRYVDVADFGAFPPSTIIIDFNEAYNPNCARSGFFTCPIAVDNIPVAVRVGERDPHMAH